MAATSASSASARATSWLQQQHFPFLILSSPLPPILKVHNSSPCSRQCDKIFNNHFCIAMSAKAKVSESVVAGFPSPAEQPLEPPLDLNELLVRRPAATYFVRVEGESIVGEDKE